MNVTLGLGLFIVNVWRADGTLLHATRVDSMEAADIEVAACYAPGGYAEAVGFVSGTVHSMTSVLARKRKAATRF